MHQFLFLVDGLDFSAVTTEQAPFLFRHRVCAMQQDTAGWASVLSGLRPDQHGVVNSAQVATQQFTFGFTTVLNDVKGPVLAMSDWPHFHRFFPLHKRHVLYHSNIWTRLVPCWQAAHRPVLTVVNFDCLDKAGYACGWDSTAFKVALRQTDLFFARLEEQLRQLKVPFQAFVVGKGPGDKAVLVCFGQGAQPPPLQHARHIRAMLAVQRRTDAAR